MRCLAFAQAWQDAGGQVTFALAMQAPALTARLQREAIEVRDLAVVPGSTADAARTVTLAQQLGAQWVVVDGYHFDGDYQRRLKDAGLRLLFIDDEGDNGRYFADLVLNQNLHAHAGLYPDKEPYTRLLLGLRYAMLRREFWPWRDWQREVPETARKILVTLGGGDPENVTGKVIQALEQAKVEAIEAIVIAGGANHYSPQLEKSIDNLPFSARLARNVADMAELMAWADLSITAGGSTCWETAFMGLPSLVIILAENQRPVAVALSAAKVARNLGFHQELAPDNLTRALGDLLADQAARAEMSQRGQTLVDGEGPARVLMHLLDRPLRVRPVRAKDCQLVWEWANEPATRAVSFSTGFIPWDSHVQWFQDRIKDSQCRFYIALDGDDVPVGQARFSLQGEEATISVSLDKPYRNQGYGPVLIRLSCDHLFAETPVNLVHAYMKPDNLPSLKVFQKAGFSQASQVEVQSQASFHCQLRRGAWAR